MRTLGWICGLLGLFALIAAGASYAVLKPEGFDWVAMVAIGGLVGVGVWFGTYWSTLKELGDDSSIGRTAVSLFAIVLAFGIASVANVAMHRYDKRWDLTKDQRYSLSQQSIDIASKLSRDVQVDAFFTTGSPEESNFKNLMEGYQERSTLLKVNFHDPYSDPLLAEQMKILSDRGTVVLKSGEQTQRLETVFGEEAFTNALVRVTSDTFHSVCAVTGHGERDTDDEYGQEGLGFAKIKMEGQNYRVSKLSLLERQPTPADCEVVVLAGPQAELAPSERDRLARYVVAGGGLVVMLDPLQTPETAADMARYGLKVGNDVVVEADPNRQFQGGNPTMVVLDPSSFDFSPITEKLRGVSVLVMARSVAKGADIPGLNVQELARGTDASWGETTLSDPNIPAVADPGQDVVGKVPLMASVEVSDPAAIRTTTDAAVPTGDAGGLNVAAPAAELPAPEPKAGGKVVVFGDSDFASNLWFTKYTNQDLFLNAVAWMAGEKDQLSIRANEAAKGKLELSVLSLLLSILASVLLLPGLGVMGLVGTWMYRRKL